MCHVKYEIQHVCYTYTPLQYISEKSLDLMSLRHGYIWKAYGKPVRNDNCILLIAFW